MCCAAYWWHVRIISDSEVQLSPLTTKNVANLIALLRLLCHFNRDISHVRGQGFSFPRLASTKSYCLQPLSLGQILHSKSPGILCWHCIMWCGKWCLKWCHFLLVWKHKTFLFPIFHAIVAVRLVSLIVQHKRLCSTCLKNLHYLTNS